ncbi:MAG: cellulose binding domain-containing protein, partial [Reinekea sp.]
MADIHRFLKCPTPQGWIDVAEVSSNEWMAFLKEHNLTHLNWAVSDKNEGASIIVPGANPYGYWEATDLTASGTYVKSVISNWDNDDPDGGTEPIPQGNVNCEHLIINPWPDGFQGKVVITNNTSSTINGWQVNWSYNDSSVITQSWC